MTYSTTCMRCAVWLLQQFLLYIRLAGGVVLPALQVEWSPDHPGRVRKAMRSADQSEDLAIRAKLMP